ncbi:MAG TPA: hypothetical protein VGA64_05295 [Candidatus Polarisedimenticolia bacterium]
MKLLMVSVGAGRYAVAAEAVAKIMDPALDPGFRHEGNSAEAIHDGTRYPVVEIDPGARGAGGLYLLLGKGGARALMPVDSAESIQDVSGTAIAPLPTFIFAGARRPVRGIFADGRTPRLLLDLDTFL